MLTLVNVSSTIIFFVLLITSKIQTMLSSTDVELGPFSGSVSEIWRREIKKIIKIEERQGS